VIHFAGNNAYYPAQENDMAKTTTIEGMVVSTGGLSAMKSDTWEHVFFLCPWREVGGAAQKKQLRVVMPAKNRAAIDKAGRFRGKNVAITASELRAPAKDLPFGFAQGTFPPKVAKPDADMKAAVLDRDRPRAIKDATLGKLKYLVDLDCLAGRCQLNGQRGELLLFVREIDIDDPKAVAKAIARAIKSFATVESKLKGIVGRVVADLLDTYNGSWNTGAPIGQAAFTKQLKFDAVHLGPRDATVYFKAGRLFRGHVVEARLGSTGGVREVCLAG
jgi:hypothetical protein